MWPTDTPPTIHCWPHTPVEDAAIVPDKVKLPLPSVAPIEVVVESVQFPQLFPVTVTGVLGGAPEI